VIRREFITLLGGAVAAWPLAVHAQQSENVARIGFLPLGSPSNHYDLSYVEAFRNGLTDNGLVDGRNIRVDVVWVTNEAEYDQAVVELVRRGARVLVPAGSSASAAAKRQTSTIPIIFISVGDPVGIGIVESLPILEVTLPDLRTCSLICPVSSSNLRGNWARGGCLSVISGITNGRMDSIGSSQLKRQRKQPGYCFCPEASATSANWMLSFLT